MKRIDITKVLLGSDPEFFLRLKSDNSIVSAEGIIGGTKHEPIYITGEGHGISEDGVTLECVFPPSNDPYEFKKNLDTVLDYVKEKHPEYRIDAIPSAILEEKYLQSRQATTVGCSVDFDVWENKPAKVPNYEKTSQRYAGGHLHIGYENPEYDTNRALVKALDVFLGVPSVLFDKDNDRRRIYGVAGRYRPKPYGLEYRSLSNVWLKSQRTINWVFNNTKEAILFLNNGFTVPEEDKKWIQKAMAESDVKLAQQIVDEYEVFTPEYLMQLA